MIVDGCSSIALDYGSLGGHDADGSLRVAPSCQRRHLEIFGLSLSTRSGDNTTGFRATRMRCCGVVQLFSGSGGKPRSVPPLQGLFDGTIDRLCGFFPLLGLLR